MHEFQPYPIDLLEFNPFTKLSNEWMLITAGDRRKANAMTASWGGLGVLWGKNIAVIFVRESRYTKEFIDNGEYFSCCFFGPKYKNALKYFGAASGRQEDKFKAAKLNLNYKRGIPFVDEGNFIVLCQKWRPSRSGKSISSSRRSRKNGIPARTRIISTPCTSARSWRSWRGKD